MLLSVVRSLENGEESEEPGREERPDCASQMHKVRREQHTGRMKREEITLSKRREERAEGEKANLLRAPAASSFLCTY